MEVLAVVGFAYIMRDLYRLADRYFEYRLMNSTWNVKKQKWEYKKPI